MKLTPLGKVDPAATCTGDWQSTYRDCLDALAAGDVPATQLCAHCTQLLMTAVEWVAGRDIDWADVYRLNAATTEHTEAGES